MKVLWIIKKLDGSQIKVETSESTEPIPGDGKIVKRIPVVIDKVLKTPSHGQLGKHDLAIEAIEQRG